MEKVFKGKITIDKNYQSTIDSIRLISSNKNENKINFINDFNHNDYIENDNYEISCLDDSIQNLLPPKESLLHQEKIKILAGYDESILELKSLQGQLRCVSHLCCLQNNEEYIPIGFLSLKFYTKSKNIELKSNKFSEIVYTQDINKSINDNYHFERIKFLNEYIPEDSLVFIDGSIFSGANTFYNFDLCSDLNLKNITPFFFVKNSTSEKIKENYPYASGFNNDLDWAKLNQNSHLITGSICGYKIEEIENPLMQNVRKLDKLVDELAKGKKMEKILR